MKIRFPRGIEVDINNVPEDFDEIIRKSFEEYTALTKKEYRYQDKLCFIDRCAELLHEAEDEADAVKNLILKQTEFELDEYGEFPCADDFWNMGFMEECYKEGKEDMCLYSHYTKDHHEDEKIMQLLYRVVKVVINYEG